MSDPPKNKVPKLNDPPHRFIRPPAPTVNDVSLIRNKNKKAVTGLDRESAHPLQLHAVKRSCCTAAYPGATGKLCPGV